MGIAVSWCRCGFMRRARRAPDPRGDPSEDAPLRLDHGEPALVEFGEVGCAAIAEDDAAVAAVVRVANGGVDANLRRDPQTSSVSMSLSRNRAPSPVP